MADAITVIAGLPIPQSSQVFLATVGLPVLAGMVCVVAGAVAMLSRKGRGRHSGSCRSSRGRGCAIRWSAQHRQVSSGVPEPQTSQLVFTFRATRAPSTAATAAMTAAVAAG